MRQQLLIGAAVLVLALGLALILPTLDLTDAPFSAYDTEEKGTSVLIGGLRAQGFQVQALSLGPSGIQGIDPTTTETLYVAIGVDRGFTGPELDALFDFIEEGGQAVILDDTGASQSLLNRLEVDRGSLLFSTTGDQPSVVQATVDGQAVTLWEPVELIPQASSTVEVLATTETTVAKDTNDNGEIEANEPTCGGAGCVVAIRQSMGEGRLTFIADATFATNRYASGTDVIQLVVDLAAGTGQSQRSLVVVDESRHVAGPSEVGLTAFRTLLVPLGIPMVPWIVTGLILVATVAAVLRRSSGEWEPHTPGLDNRYLPQERQVAPETEGDAP